MNHELPKLGKVDMGSDFSLDLDYYLTKSYDDIGEAASELPAIIEWVNIQLQSVTEQKMVLKQSLKTTRARSYVDLKNGGFSQHLTAPGAKPTDQSVEYLIELDPGVEEVNRELAIITGWGSRLSNLLYVLQAKLDLVRSTESTRRQLVVQSQSDEE